MPTTILPRAPTPWQAARRRANEGLDRQAATMAYLAEIRADAWADPADEARRALVEARLRRLREAERVYQRDTLERHRRAARGPGRRPREAA